ncbi:MAG: hypothetical protein JWN76_2371 [Chitinophagaceae bacterium]|nr:hypothetical protein [Chitinophagaceae bacterium]
MLTPAGNRVLFLFLSTVSFFIGNLETMPRHPSNVEKELMLRISGGDHHAFTQLFDSYHHALGAFIFGITKSHELSEEIVLDVFLKIWMTREALVEVKNFKAYIFIVARNAAVSALRKIITERTRQTEWKNDPAAIPAEAMEDKEAWLSVIDEAINQLSPQRKKIYFMSREKGLKYEEIATQLGISKLTVRAHIQQSIAFIARFLRTRINNGLILFIILHHFFK